MFGRACGTSYQVKNYIPAGFYRLKYEQWAMGITEKTILNHSHSVYDASYETQGEVGEQNFRAIFQIFISHFWIA